jgi:hypothetical protein
MVPPTLIEKKRRGKRGFLNNTSHGVDSMKWHIKSEHTNILITYVVNFVVVSETCHHQKNGMMVVIWSPTGQETFKVNT